MLRRCSLASKCGKAFVTTLYFRFTMIGDGFYSTLIFLLFFAKYHQFSLSSSLIYLCSLCQCIYFIVLFSNFSMMQLSIHYSTISIQTCLLKLRTGALKLHRKHFKMISETVKKYDIFYECFLSLFCVRIQFLFYFSCTFVMC